MSFFTIPNVVSYLRFILTLISILCFYFFSFKFLTLVLFLILAITDFLDGYLARLLGQESLIGELIDPLVDKIAISTFLILVVQSYPFNYITVPIMFIICREIFVSSLREFYSKQYNYRMKVSYFGKTKTFFQILSIIFFLLDLTKFVVVYKFGILFLYFSLVPSLISMMQYTLPLYRKEF